MDPLSASIINASVVQSQSLVAQQTSNAVLKKAMDIEASAAAALVQALPPPPNTPELGSLIDVYA